MRKRVHPDPSAPSPGPVWGDGLLAGRSEGPGQPGHSQTRSTHLGTGLWHRCSTWTPAGKSPGRVALLGQSNRLYREPHTRQARSLAGLPATGRAA